VGLKILGGLDKYAHCVGSSPLIEGNLAAQVLHPGGPQLIDRTGLTRSKERESVIDRASTTFVPGRGELAFGAFRRVGR
jgi:hypothetical protein